MDPNNPDIQLLILVLLGLGAVVTIIVYAVLGIRIAGNGGKISVEKFGMADLLVCVLLAGFLICMVISGFKTPPRESFHDSDLVNNAILDAIVVATLCSFMYFRGFKLGSQFGLRALKLHNVAGIAFLLLVAVYPLMLCANIVTQQMLGPEAKPQELIKFFSEASRQMHVHTLVYTFVTGTVVAPIAEEFVFRGYIYGTLKRYLGITAGVVLNAALFAAIHLNAAALPQLFILAVCLTLAYEFTGSILVNMCMHGLFNFFSLLLTLYLSTYFQQ